MRVSFCFFICPAKGWFDGPGWPGPSSRCPASGGSNEVSPPSSRGAEIGADPDESGSAPAFELFDAHARAFSLMLRLALHRSLPLSCSASVRVASPSLFAPLSWCGPASRRLRSYLLSEASSRFHGFWRELSVQHPREMSEPERSEAGRRPCGGSDPPRASAVGEGSGLRSSRRPSGTSTPGVRISGVARPTLPIPSAQRSAHRRAPLDECLSAGPVGFRGR